jgi:hypothetical protein
MLNVLRDGPFRYIHSAATGELILTLASCGSRFFDYECEDAPRLRSLREWKAIARRRLGRQLITDGEQHAR